MTDEFPTLEAALLVSALFLGWRGWLLTRARREFGRDLERLLVLLADPAARRATGTPHFGDTLEPVARALFLAQVNAEPRSAQARSTLERGARAELRLRSAAARDLVICAVLSGSLAYAAMARLGVSTAFFALGGIATLLLLLAVKDRVQLGRALRLGTERISALVLQTPNDERASAARRCRSCGQAFPAPLTGEALGPALSALGAREIYVCGQCGRIEGHAAPRT